MSNIWKSTVALLRSALGRIRGNRVPVSRPRRADEIPAHLAAVASRQPGLTCPKCSYRIQITIPMLLSGQPVICSQCFLRLDIDRSSSKESLLALEKLHADFERAKEMIK
jgi:hypothetical protein